MKEERPVGVSLEFQHGLAGKYYEASQNLVFRKKR